MGVRINSGVSTAKVSAQQASAKTDGGQPAGADTDFSKVLAKAQPKSKKSADAAPAPDKPVKQAPTAKAVEKKPAKGKVKGEQSQDPQSVTPEGAARETDAKPETNESIPVGDGDEAIAAETIDQDIERPEDDDSKAIHAEAAPIQPDPSQVVIQTTPAPVQTSDAVISDDSQEGQPVQAAPVTDQQPTSEAKPIPAEMDDQKDVERPAKHDADAPKPVPTAGEAKAVVRPVSRQGGEHTAGDQQQGAEVRTHAKADGSHAAKAADSVSRFNELFQAATEDLPTDTAEKPAAKAPPSADVTLPAFANGDPGPKAAEAKPANVAPAPVAPELRFAEDNHPKVVTAVKTQLLPGGGAIQLRLDPPDLGPLRLEVRMEDGAMSASFVTASDQATSLLTHSLGQLKNALEGAGISVDKLQVRQGSAEQFSENSDQRQQGGTGDQSSARQEQQRREMLNRMWQKVAGGDPLDLVA